MDRTLWCGSTTLRLPARLHHPPHLEGEQAVGQHARQGLPPSTRVRALQSERPGLHHCRARGQLSFWQQRPVPSRRSCHMHLPQSTCNRLC